MKLTFDDLETVLITIEQPCDIDRLENKLSRYYWFQAIYPTTEGVCVEVCPEYGPWSLIDDHFDELEANTRNDIMPRIEEAAR